MATTQTSSAALQPAKLDHRAGSTVATFNYSNATDGGANTLTAAVATTFVIGKIPNHVDIIRIRKTHAASATAPVTLGHDTDLDSILAATTVGAFSDYLSTPITVSKSDDAAAPNDALFKATVTPGTTTTVCTLSVTLEYVNRKA